MRIIILLAAAGLAAIGTSAPARPGGGSGGHGASTPGGWGPDDGRGARGGWQGRADRGGDRDRGRFRHRGRNAFFLDGGFGLAGPTGLVSPWGDGFFAGGGGEVRTKDGRPHYDYDRSYPYEWASAAGGRGRRWEVTFVSEPPPRCTLEQGVRVCRGW